MESQEKRDLTNLAGVSEGAFTLLHHTGVPTPHFDLLVQLPPQEKLITWRLPPLMMDFWPPSSALNPVVFRAERLPDHRAIYMTYEGPISGNRGEAKRVWSGMCKVDISEGSVIVQLTDGKRVCVLRLPVS